MNILSGLSAFFKSTLITKASSLITQLVLGFYLSQEDFGIYGIVLSLTVFTNCFGIGIIQKVLVQKGDAFRSHGEYSSIAFLFGFASFIILIFAGFFFSSDHINRDTFLFLTIILAVTTLLQSLVPIQKASLLVKSHYRSVATLDAIVNGLSNLLAIPLCLIGLGPYSFIAHKPFVYIYEYIKYNRILLDLNQKIVKLPTFSQIKSVSLVALFKEFKWLFLGAFFTAFILKGDYLVLSYLVDIKLIGIYFFAYQLSFSIANLFTASVINNVLLPELANKKSLSDKNIFLSRCLIIILLIFSPLFFALSHFSESVILFIWGNKWEASIIIVKLLFIIMPLRLIPALLRVYLESQGKWKSSTLLNAISAIGVLIAALIGGMTDSITGIALSITFWFACLGLGAMTFSIRAIGEKKFAIKMYIIVLNLYLGLAFFYILSGTNALYFFLVMAVSLMVNLWIVRKELNYFTDNLLGKSYATLWLDRIKSFYRFLIFHKRVPNIINPRRMTDLVLKKRLIWNPQSKIEIHTADKLSLRDYVAEHLGDGHLPKLYGVIEIGEKFNFDSFEYPCVLKSNHGTNHVLFLKSRNSFNEDETIKTVNKWLLDKWFPVWYRYISPKIICEEFLSTNKTFSIENVPNDFKFFVFNGKVEFICVDLGRFSGHKRSLFTRDWELIDVEYLYPKGGYLEKPYLLKEMIVSCETLAGSLNFVRVDLYLIGDKIIVGELTHSPDAGRMRFNPDSFDYFIDKRD